MKIVIKRCKAKGTHFMNEELVIIGLVTAVTALIFEFINLVDLYGEFKDSNRYIYYRMNCAENYDEYRRWRGELRCQYLMILPFIDGDNVMKMYRLIFRRSKKKNVQKSEQKNRLK